MPDEENNTPNNEPEEKSEYRKLLKKFGANKDGGLIHLTEYERELLVSLFEVSEARQSIVYGQIVDTFKQLGDFVSQVTEIKEVVSKLSKEFEEYNPKTLVEKITELKSGYDKLSEQLSEISNKFGGVYTNSVNQISEISEKPDAQPEVSSNSATDKNVYSQLDELYNSIGPETKYTEVAKNMQIIIGTFPELNKALEPLIQDFNKNEDSKIKDSDLDNLKNVINDLKVEYKK